MYSKRPYHVYILLCADETLYTGIAANIERRVAEHNGGKSGARYTRGRRPVKLAYSRKFKNRSEALKEEYRIKRLSRNKKKDIIGANGNK